MKDRPKPIETAVWQKKPDGYLHRTGQRTVRDVAKEVEQSMKDAGLSYEYVSYDRNMLDENVTLDWPTGEVYVALQVGGNEGYKLVVYVSHAKVETYGNVRAKGEIVYSPIWVKLLCSREDALKAHEHLFHVMGS